MDFNTSNLLMLLNSAGMRVAGNGSSGAPAAGSNNTSTPSSNNTNSNSSNSNADQLILTMALNALQSNSNSGHPHAQAHTQPRAQPNDAHSLAQALLPLLGSSPPPASSTTGSTSSTAQRTSTTSAAATETSFLLSPSQTAPTNANPLSYESLAGLMGSNPPLAPAAAVAPPPGLAGFQTLPTVSMHTPANVPSSAAAHAPRTQAVHTALENMLLNANANVHANPTQAQPQPNANPPSNPTADLTQLKLLLQACLTQDPTAASIQTPQTATQAHILPNFFAQPQPQPPQLPSTATIHAAAQTATSTATNTAAAEGDRKRRRGRSATFPQKLHQMLEDMETHETTDIASFVDGGNAFAIHKPKEFAETVMPKYFKMGSFASFQRQLNLYDFIRIAEGPDRGAYRHDLFVRGKPILSTTMRRTKIKSHAREALSSYVYLS